MRSPLRCFSNKSPEVLEVEVLMPDVEEENPYGFLQSDEMGSEGVRDDTAVAENITKIDTFARAKVGNFFNRMLSSTTVSSSSSRQVVVAEVREVQTAGAEERLFHAKVRIPLPAAYGERWGEGLAPTEKEAEMVAIMHAERVIDALGFPMFQLTSKQQRHAEAARQAGRWAPMPDESPRSPSTPSPPRLHLLRESALKAVERQLHIEHIEFARVTIGAFRPMKLTLASPFFLDLHSVYRVKQFFAAYDCNIQCYCSVTPLHKHTRKIENQNPTDISEGPEKEMYVAQLGLPVDKRFGERIACGKAPTKKEAFALACMHAELIIDALGLALYPSSRDQQKLHAEECRKVNRWCAEPDSCEYHYTIDSPPPLELVKGNGDTAMAEVGATVSVESALMRHAKAINSFTNTKELDKLVPLARCELINYMAGQNTTGKGSDSPFFVESLGIKDHLVYRASVIVPVPVVEIAAMELKANGDSNNGVSSTADLLSSFVALGIGVTDTEAEIAASMHALSVLEMLHRPLVCHMAHKNGKSCLNLTRDMHIPPPFRYVVEHIGRIMVPGLLGSSQRRDLSVENHKARLRTAQAELPRSEWSLDADIDGYIIVNPNTTVHEGRNYVHTLSSVRQADRFASLRLQDYLERHGKRLENVVLTTIVETDEGLKRWVKKVFLPVPETFGRVVAHGEAYTEEEALAMCALHAELVLDELGIALYDFYLLQGKHCDTAAMLGRWVPCKTLEKPRTVHLPPPVRKEHIKSSLWARLSKERSKYHIKEEVSKLTIRELGEKEKAKSCVVISSNAKENMTDDVLCDLTGLVSVHPTEFNRHAIRILSNYCERKGVDISTQMRQYSIQIPPHGLVHRAIMEIPLPAQFSRCYAVACASSKKIAFHLCCMHAVLTLDKLGVPISKGVKQSGYITMAQPRVCSPPKSGDTLNSESPALPSGLKYLEGVAHLEELQVPIPPSPVECANFLLWNGYVTRCKIYIQKKGEKTLFQALFTEKRAPRSGVDLEDNGLDVIEALPLYPNVKSMLPKKCAAAGLPPPPHFHFDVYGKPPHRCYMVEQPVSGTPYTARGMGVYSNEAIARAAMHYDFIIGVITNTHQEQRHVNQVMRHRKSDLFDPTLRDYTPRGKLTIMALYTVLRAPFLPLRLMLKERICASSSKRIFVSIIELEDESGLRMTGKGEDSLTFEEAQNRAIAELYKKLQLKSAFQAIVQLMQKQPGLRAEAAAQLTNECVMAKLPLLLDGQKGPPLPLRIQDLSSGCDVVSWMSRSTDCFSSSGLELLFKILEQLSKCVTTPYSVTMPLASRCLLTTMGLITVDSVAHDSKTRIQPNAIGVISALIATCLPQPVVGTKMQPSLNGVLPLQLVKLFLAGHLLNCQHLCIRLAAMVLSWVGENTNSKEASENNDVLESVAQSLSPRAEHFVSLIVSRLQELALKLDEKTTFPRALSDLVNSLSNAADNALNPIPDRIDAKEQARLRLAMVFASFPMVFLQQKGAVDGVSPLVSVISKDRQRTVHVAVPPPFVASTTLSSDLTSTFFYSSFPCFCTLDGSMISGTVSEGSHVIGSFAPPCAMLLASACSDEPHMVVVTDDVPNVAIVNGVLPVVMHTPTSLTALIELRLTINQFWKALKPLPSDIQSVVDELLMTKHSLMNIAQAGLLE